MFLTVALPRGAVDRRRPSASRSSRSATACWQVQRALRLHGRRPTCPRRSALLRAHGLRRSSRWRPRTSSSRDIVVPTLGGGMAHWREKLFAGDAAQRRQRRRLLPPARQPRGRARDAGADRAGSAGAGGQVPLLQPRDEDQRRLEREAPRPAGARPARRGSRHSKRSTSPSRLTGTTPSRHDRLEHLDVLDHVAVATGRRIVMRPRGCEVCAASSIARPASSIVSRASVAAIDSPAATRPPISVSHRPGSVDLSSARCCTQTAPSAVRPTRCTAWVARPSGAHGARARRARPRPLGVGRPRAARRASGWQTPLGMQPARDARRATVVGRRRRRASRRRPRASAGPPRRSASRAPARCEPIGIAGAASESGSRGAAAERARAAGATVGAPARRRRQPSPVVPGRCRSLASSASSPASSSTGMPSSLRLVELAAGLGAGDHVVGLLATPSRRPCRRRLRSSPWPRRAPASAACRSARRSCRPAACGARAAALALLPVRRRRRAAARSPRGCAAAAKKVWMLSATTGPTSGTSSSCSTLASMMRSSCRSGAPGPSPSPRRRGGCRAP